MPVIHIPRGLAVAQVEIPDTAGERRLERSCKGAVHLRPGIKMVTNDELAVIEKVLPKVFRRLRVVSETDKEKGKEKAEPSAPPVSESASPPSPSVLELPEDKKPKRKRD